MVAPPLVAPGAHGLAGGVLLAESHASVHTWPERGLATLGAADQPDVVPVTEEEILGAMTLLHSTAGIEVEPSAAVHW